MSRTIAIWIGWAAPSPDNALDSLSRRGIVRPAYLDALRKAHASGHASYYGVMIWILIELELWLQHNA